MTDVCVETNFSLDNLYGIKKFYYAIFEIRARMVTGGVYEGDKN